EHRVFGSAALAEHGLFALKVPVQLAARTAAMDLFAAAEAELAALQQRLFHAFAPHFPQCRQARVRLPRRWPPLRPLDDARLRRSTPPTPLREASHPRRNLAASVGSNRPVRNSYSARNKHTARRRLARWNS